MYGFGLGFLAFTDTTDTATARKTPIICGVLQDVTLEIAMQSKALRGNLKFPVDVAGGAGSVSGKAKFAQIGIASIAAILNATPDATSVASALNEAHTPTTNTFTLTPTGGGSFYENIAVIRQSDGMVMTRMPDATAQGSLTTGQYTCTTSGTPTVAAYSFCTADSNPPVNVTYTYSDSDIGQEVVLNNQLMGALPSFTLNLHNSFRSKHFGWRLPNVTIPKLGWAPKVDDYTTIDLDFEAFADASGQVLKFFSKE